MSISYRQALSEREFHYGQCSKEVGPRGGVKVHMVVVRRNGMTQTWKTRPTEFSIPVKHGLKNAFRIGQADAHLWHAASDCPLNQTEQALAAGGAL